MGPVSWQELVVAARTGGLGASDLVWAEGMAQWQAASTIPGLLPPAPAPAAVPPARPAPAPPPARPAPAQTVYTAPSPAQPAPAVAPRPATADPAPRPAYARPAGRAAASHAPQGWVFVPAGWSGWAVASGYLGLLSLLGYPAIASLIVGIVALRDLRKHPEKQGRRRAWFGLIMGALGTIAVAVIVGSTWIRNLPGTK
jgi:hypothetical protein